jgi:GH18 family chitinase
MTYYPAWCYGYTGNEYKVHPRTGVPWNRVDIAIHFAASFVDASPYFGPVQNEADSLGIQYYAHDIPTSSNPGQYGNWQDTLIRAGHAAGKKVLICWGVIGGGAHAVFSDSASLELAVYNIAKYCQRKGYDGSDIDWEYPDNATNHARYARFMQRAFTALNDGKHYLVLTSSVNANTVYSTSNCPLYMDAYVDYYVPQMYQPSVWNGSHGFNDFIHMSALSWTPAGTCAGQDGPYHWGNWQAGALSAQGHAKSKIVPSVPSYGVYMTNSNAFCAQAPNFIGSGPRWRDIEGFRLHGATYHWDDVAKESWLSGPTTSAYSADQISVGAGSQLIVSYCDTATMRSRANYVVAQGWAGIFTYDLSTGARVANQPGSDSNNPFEAIAWHVFNP